MKFWLVGNHFRHLSSITGSARSVVTSSNLIRARIYIIILHGPWTHNFNSTHDIYSLQIGIKSAICHKIFFLQYNLHYLTWFIFKTFQEDNIFKKMTQV